MSRSFLLKTVLVITLLIAAIVAWQVPAVRMHFPKPIYEGVASYTDVTLEEYVAWSDIIVYGTVVDTQPIRDPGDRNNRFMQYVVKPIEVFRNVQGVSTDTIAMHSREGEFWDRKVTSEGKPVLHVGDTAVFILRYDAEKQLYYRDYEMVLSPSGALAAFPGDHNPESVLAAMANGKATLDRLRTLSAQAPRGSPAERTSWAASFHRAATSTH